ncbi:unnamed protein product [Rotaria sordida]|uniref:UAS domain-containing protein n=1 Tax=Rotaria sordida TaxID=392033 RepID=A0A815EFI2_9BILA|nr:unnamed protein product [Rotaria sordida]
MTDENNMMKLAIESDIEEDDNDYADDKSNATTTDDEFYNELMNAPSECEDHLIPNECKDEITAIEHLTSCLNRRYNSCPVVFTGTLKDALNEAFNSKEIKERRPLLIYVNNDKSLYSNLFCKQLLCNDKIIEYLLNNYVLWAWDVTFPSNGEKLNEIFKTTFSQWKIGYSLGTCTNEQYPFLIGIRRSTNGDYLFDRLIDGSNKRPVIDEFFAHLMEYKDRFDFSEEQFEREKERCNQNIIDKCFQTHDFHHPSRYHDNPHIYPSTTMFPSINFDGNNPHYPRFLNNHSHRSVLHNNNDNLPDIFRQLHIHSNNNDDYDDNDDDDDEQTPTINRPLPKFPE